MDGKTILVVDDDEDLVRSLGIRLRRKGYEVYTAMDGNQAVMQAHKHQPDLVILDIMMPAGSGFKVMDKLSISTHTMGTPVIVLTAFDSEETRVQAKALGAFRYFVKPFNFDVLLFAVSEALGESQDIEPD